MVQPGTFFSGQLPYGTPSFSKYLDVALDVLKKNEINRGYCSHFARNVQIVLRLGKSVS